MPPRKRAASTVLDEPRRSRRISSTPKKSIYFQGDEGSDDPLSGGKPEKSKGKRAQTNKRSVEVEDIVSDEYQEDEAKDNEADDNEEEEEDEDDMDTKVTVVKIPALRPEGETKYADEYVHKNSMLFLKDLKQNNERPWLKSTVYQSCCWPPSLTCISS